MSSLVVGVLGGMGPDATVKFLKMLTEETVAKSDCDHIETITISDPGIPDRTKFILGKGPSPIPKLKSNISKLESVGANLVVIPCMTAHTFITELSTDTNIKIMNALKVTNNFISTNYSSAKVGLLATSGSLQSGVYERYIDNDIIKPNNIDQKRVMDIIYTLKGEKNQQIINNSIVEMQRIIMNLKSEGSNIIIAGCTELSLLLNTEFGLPVVDPLNILVKQIVSIKNNIDLQKIGSLLN